MKHARIGISSWTAVALAASFSLTGALAPSLTSAQEAPAQEPPPARTLLPKSEFRRIAPGIERDINSERDFRELTSVHSIPALVEKADYAWAKDVSFRHDIWALDFTFKPIRFVKVKLPGPDGKLQERLVWYMVYHVRNPGVIYRATPTEYTKAEPGAEVEAVVGDAGVDPAKKDLTPGEVVPDDSKEPIRFVPTFLLYARDPGKSYLDRVLPPAIPLIRNREDPARELKSSVDIIGDVEASTEEVDNSAWGVVTWDGVDPTTDFFSIYVQGLTNAYKWVDLPDGKKWYGRKTLRLDFWRPSDEFDEKESEIRYLRSRWTYLNSEWQSAPKSAGGAEEAATN